MSETLLLREIITPEQQFPALPDGQYVFVWTYGGVVWSETAAKEDHRWRIYQSDEDCWETMACLHGGILPMKRVSNIHIYSTRIA